MVVVSILCHRVSHYRVSPALASSLQQYRSFAKKTKPASKKSPPRPKRPTSSPSEAAAYTPPAVLLPTGSPYAFVSKWAVQSSGVDPRSLFSDVMTVSEGQHDGEDEVVVPVTSTMPPLFRQGRFQLANGDSSTPTVAVLGRSNVGKSSLLNALMRQNLAQAAKQPGRTQRAAYYGLYPNSASKKNTSDEAPVAMLMDLPGYGYAVGPDKAVDKWQVATQRELQKLQAAGNLRRVLLLTDARRDFGHLDMAVSDWLQENEMPYSVVVTKADTVRLAQVIRLVNLLCLRYQQLATQEMVYGEEAISNSMSPIIHVTSGRLGSGLNELLSTLETEFLLEEA